MDNIWTTKPYDTLPRTPDYTRAKMMEAGAQGATPPRHRFGFNVRPGVNYAKLLEQVKAMGGCSVMVFHEYAGGLGNIRPFLDWVDVPIWRPAEWTSETLYQHTSSAASWVEYRHNEMVQAGFNAQQLWLHLHNEAGWYLDMLEWEAAATDYAAKRLGAKVVALNQAVGNPNEYQVHLARPILELAAKYPDRVLIGTHEYFSVTGDRKYPWYLGRWQASPTELNGGHSYESYRQAVGLGPIGYVITEAGAEDIADDQPYTSTLPRTGKRPHVGPVHANDAAWSKLYGAAYKGKDAQYLAELQTAYPTGRWNDPRIVGIALYSWGAGGKDKEWTDYDVSEMGAFKGDLAKTAFPVAAPIEPPPVPVPPIDPYREVRAVLHDTPLLNVRESQTTNALRVAEITPGVLIGYVWPPVVGEDIGGGRGNLWVKVRVDGTTGYAHKFYLTLPEDAPTPIPEPPPADDDPADVPMPPVTRAEYEAALARIEALEEVIEGLRVALNVSKSEAA